MCAVVAWFTAEENSDCAKKPPERTAAVSAAEGKEDDEENPGGMPPGIKPRDGAPPGVAVGPHGWARNVRPQHMVLRAVEE